MGVASYGWRSAPQVPVGSRPYIPDWNQLREICIGQVPQNSEDSASSLDTRRKNSFDGLPASIYAYTTTCLCTWRRGGTTTRRNESLEWPLLLLVGCLETVGAWNVENLQINNNKLNNNCNYNDTNVFMRCSIILFALCKRIQCLTQQACNPDSIASPAILTLHFQDRLSTGNVTIWFLFQDKMASMWMREAKRRRILCERRPVIRNAADLLMRQSHKSAFVQETAHLEVLAKIPTYIRQLGIIWNFTASAGIRSGEFYRRIRRHENEKQLQEQEEKEMAHEDRMILKEVEELKESNGNGKITERELKKEEEKDEEERKGKGLIENESEGKAGTGVCRVLCR
ncbi:hypothetical protein CAPTEDRAFT_220805 [Capitella teleta]|uniref:Uncharacterized protein n=1 Tax=Capitella teleta TaxID=283909 RepID=R7U2E1_CAPTE|nr:hypothetical protein CAPTEDRAFT_220805 [Capitella teleta]|eukprot:ELU00175.1 hypothetical protein CAPTEDRAFT_220805 [Capitella teleta]